MGSFKPEDEAYIVDAFITKGNIGRKVKLLKYVAPGDVVRFYDGEWEGGDTGVWIVIPTDNGTLLRVLMDDEVFQSPMCACAKGHLMSVREYIASKATPLIKRTKFG